MLCSELFLRSNQWLFFQLRVSVRNYFTHGPFLAVFPQWWNIMNVSHYVAVVHWANKLTDLTSALLNCYRLCRVSGGLCGLGGGLSLTIGAQELGQAGEGQGSTALILLRRISLLRGGPSPFRRRRWKRRCRAPHPCGLMVHQVPSLPGAEAKALPGWGSHGDGPWELPWE